LGGGVQISRAVKSYRADREVAVLSVQLVQHDRGPAVLGIFLQFKDRAAAVGIACFGIASEEGSSIKISGSKQL